jgi:alkanesulfonate monooxygenase SsuD/methylene tetrahydromethanopterin reductase-like flavin-dependent oxidoreductase (luciferase family)
VPFGDTRIVKCGFIVTTGDPRTIADLAAEAEAAGWDGVFYWDGISIGEMDTYDTWVVLAAMAMRTERVRLGAIVTPPSRGGPGSSPERRFISNVDFGVPRSMP